ncbi:MULTISPECIES: threonine/serine exporter family protein [Enterococcus]|uniref:Threonine/serine exporter family protein n=1 Tax=Enterococcus alishanensis TaxID=1303817 RepID=A0ABS6TBX8_9ENTE|nr:threonine/serine exporter family protein [Enterococcus alishanensis]MBV7390413.1 threonine/serine exporter family protein [Enterococcus alishanensis]
MNPFFQILTGFLGTVSFAILFEVPKKYYIWCGTIGAIGWGIYLAFMHFVNAPIAATFVASLALIYLSREASFALRAPVTIFLICGIFCLVPGLGIYNFTYNFFIGDSIEAAQIGVQVLKIAIAISLGISVGYELSPNCFYSYHRRKKLAE